MTDVDLTGLSDPLRAFHAYWDSLPKTNLIPKLSDFLDRMPPELAPYTAIVDVRGPQDTKIRFFGTQIVERAAFDPTWMTVAQLYPEALRPKVHALIWETVTRPVGYVSHRTIVGRSGFVNVHPSLGLPIDVPTAGVRGVVNYSLSLATGSHLVEDRAYLVQEMAVDRWIDVGAGVPAFA